MKEKAAKCYLKTNEVLLDADGHAYLSWIFIKVQELKIVLSAIQTLDVLIFFTKMFWLISGLQLTPSDVRSFLPDNLLYLGLRQSHEFSGSEQMQMVFTTEQFLKVAVESWSESDLSYQVIVLSLCVYIDICICIYLYIYIHEIHACIIYIHFIHFIYTHFFISNNFISNIRLKLAKNQTKSREHPEAELLLFEKYIYIR